MNLQVLQKLQTHLSKEKDIRGNPNYHTVSHWFDLNLKLAMGKFASVIGESNIAQLLSFYAYTQRKVSLSMILQKHKKTLLENI